MKEFNYAADNRFFYPISLKEVIESKSRLKGKEINDVFGQCTCEKCCQDKFIKYTEDDIYYAIEKNPSSGQFNMSLLVQCPNCKDWTFIGGIC